MLESLRLNLFGSAESAGASDRSGPGLFSFGHKDESPADQFASWLPYISYLDEEQLFVNKDGMGFMLEVMPQSGADDRMVYVLVSLYSNCPPDTGVQFHLFASPHICPPLRRYANLRMEDRDQIQKAQAFGRPARNDNLYRKLARRRYAHLSHGAHHSLTQGFHYTIRDFRLMVSVSVKADPGNLSDRERIVGLRDGMGTTMGASCATRSSTTTRSRTRAPTDFTCGRRAPAMAWMCASSPSSRSLSGSGCGRWGRSSAT